ncbi:hypothetical protein DCO58_08900 [Helicobacter saguini]|uniref:Peptidase S6 domain-containing protein n=1 Tax=Helicobacter saguini TaxID=1548018 RepID=A0A347VP04_9HELI|nr:S6 family peptidase [Helicobacter saguini]MWV61562.1 hypothetical protein [Helicobacter saguini]MWV67768.1 hypothetical protein [Helicobacter saguini]MWV70764.1 hypothetical protein [Helicobacter saguini]MWV72668.1 hypothetical protein [Helicobacter saguini]TLD94529.1 hypothetical protein LS64_005000 [Helicobacter saguini]
MGYISTLDSILFKIFLVFFIYSQCVFAQIINIENFNYRDFLDFGQNKGVFGVGNNASNSIDSNKVGQSGNANIQVGQGLNPNSQLQQNGNINAQVGQGSFSNQNVLNGNTNITISGKNSNILLPNSPFINLQSQSNFGNLNHLGDGFVTTANHVDDNYDTNNAFLKFGLSLYNIAGQNIDGEGNGVSSIYGRDSKFLRFDKYVVEGESSLLESSFKNTINASDKALQEQNLKAFQAALNDFKDADGNIYLYGSGSGMLTLRGNGNTSLGMDASGERRGGFFGTLSGSGAYGTSMCNNNSTAGCVTSGITFAIHPDDMFQNVTSSGDSGSPIFAYNAKKGEWVLLGVASQSFSHLGQNDTRYSFVSDKDFSDFKDKFTQKIALDSRAWNLSNQGLESSAGGSFVGLQGNKDMLFSGGGEVSVTNNIIRNISGQAGGFIFADSNNAVKYTFSSANGQNFYFKGSGLNVGKNVTLEWALRNQSGDILHKVGDGTLVVKTSFIPADSTQNLGFLKVGQGKVILDSNTKLYEGIYIVSGRGSVELVAGKGEALGATKDSNGSYVLSQDKTSQMGIYFGSGGGILDLKGNSLSLNTIAANDSNAIILNSLSGVANKSVLEIGGFGYDTNGNKMATKADTLIHASIGNLPTRDTQGNVTNSNATNIDIVYNGNKDSGANLIFDGNINTNGSLESNNANITLQGHATTHAIISNASDRNAVIQAHKNAGNPLDSSVDLSKPSTLGQSDYDTREFNFGSGITLKNSNLNIGRNAVVNANINLDSNSKVTFGNAFSSKVTHFIDNKDAANINSNGFGYFQKLESGVLSDNLVNDSISFNGEIRAVGGVIESGISHFNATLNLSNGAKLNASFLTLDSKNSVTFSNASGEISNLHIKDINSLNNKLNLNNSTLNITKSLIFENANVSLDSIESSLQNSGATLSNKYDITAFSNSNIKANVLNGNIYLHIGATLSNNIVNLGGEKSSIVVQDSNTSLNVAQSINVKSLESSLMSAINGGNIESKNVNLENVKLAYFTSNKDSKITITETFSAKNSNINMILRDNAIFKTQILSLQDSKDSKIDIYDSASLESTKLNLNNSTLNLDSKNISINEINLENNSTLNYNVDSKLTKNITLNNNSNLNFNADSNNLQSVTLSNNSIARFNTFSYQTQQISTDSNSQIYFNTFNLAQDSNKTHNLNANTNILQNLNLNNVGNSTANDENRYHALNITQNLNLESNAKINVNFDKTILNVTGNDVETGKFYTLLSAKQLSDNRSDKKINFTFVDSNKEFFMVSKVENNAILIKFLEDNPKSFIEVNKRINPVYSDIAKILIEHNSQDSTLDTAVSTEDYDKLNVYLSNIESNLNALSKNDLRKINTNILFANNHSINTRVNYVRYAERFYNNDTFSNTFLQDSKNYPQDSSNYSQNHKDFSNSKHLKNATFSNAPLALNATNSNVESKSDIPLPNPLKDSIQENEIPKNPIKQSYHPLILTNTNAQNNAWGGISAGYFGGESSMGFYSLNVGYDRLLKDALVGVMMGYGNSSATLNSLKDSSHLLNLGIYTHVPLKNHEISSNLNALATFSNKTMTNDNANSVNFATLWNTYYKYTFNFGDKKLRQSIKPLALFGVGFNHIGEVRGNTYRMESYSDFSLELGLGAEYTLARKNLFLSVQFLARQPLFHTKDSINLTLANAVSVINYNLRKDTTAFELAFTAAHSFKERFYMQYAFLNLVDLNTNFALKADIKFGILF